MNEQIAQSYIQVIMSVMSTEPENQHLSSQQEAAEFNERLVHRMNLLKEELEGGHLQIPVDSEMIADLKAVRADSSGNVIPDTVSSRVRATALAVQAMAERREAKSINLAYVQNEYFGYLEQIFSEITKHTEPASMSPHQIADYVRSRPEFVESVVHELRGIAKDIQSFWDHFEFTVETHVQDFDGIKAVFGGDVFPSHHNNVACQAALYTDTVVVPDPIHRITSQLGTFLTKEQLAYQFVKHGLTAISYKPLVFSDTDFPIVVFGSGAQPDNEFQRQFLHVAAEADAICHLNTAFSKSFETLEEAHEYLAAVPSPEDIEAAATMPGRLLADAESESALPGRIKEHIEFRQEVAQAQMGNAPAQLIVQDAYGRMAQSNLILMRSSNYCGLPLIDAPNSWKYLLWKYEYDASRSNKTEAHSVDTQVINALVQTEEVIGEFLGLLTPQGLIALHNQGALAEVRQILNEGIADIYADGEEGNPQTAARVVKNLKDALTKHANELSEVRKAGKRYLGVDVAGFVISTTIVIAAALGGNYALSLAAALGGQVGFPSAKDLWSTGKTLVERGQRLKRTPMGILIDRM